MSFLAGKRILLTRTVEQNLLTDSLVRDYAATPVHFSCVNLEILSQNIHSALKKLQGVTTEYTDIIFSSRNGVLAVASCDDNLAYTLQHFRIVAVGKKTAQALKKLNINTAFIPTDASQQGLIQVYQTQTPPQQVFFFRAEEGSDALADYFDTLNIKTQLVSAYRTTCNTEDASPMVQELRHQRIDAVLLGSAKTALFYCQRIANLELANQPIIAVISKQVAEAADKLGLNVQVIAEEPSFKAMLDGLNQHFTELTERNPHVF